MERKAGPRGTRCNSRRLGAAAAAAAQANVYAVMNIISAVWTLIPVLYEEAGTIQVPRAAQSAVPPIQVAAAAAASVESGLRTPSRSPRPRRNLLSRAAASRIGW